MIGYHNPIRMDIDSMIDRYHNAGTLGIDTETLEFIDDDDAVDSANAIGFYVSRDNSIQSCYATSASSITAGNAAEIFRELSVAGAHSSPAKPPEPRIEPIRYRAGRAVRRNAVCTCGSGRKFKHCCRKSKVPA